MSAHKWWKGRWCEISGLEGMDSFSVMAGELRGIVVVSQGRVLTVDCWYVSFLKSSWSKCELLAVFPNRTSAIFPTHDQHEGGDDFIERCKVPYQMKLLILFNSFLCLSSENREIFIVKSTGESILRVILIKGKGVLLDHYYLLASR